jgi:hypothetical protein
MALEGCGFAGLQWCAHGESDDPALRDLERHERYDDTRDIPHVLIVEAERGAPHPTAAEALRRLIREGLGRYL